MATPKRPRVLVVEDEPDMNNLLADVLSAFEMEPIQAADAQQALEVLDREPVDAILLDLMLPGLSGYELCRRLKTARRTQTIPILILTALDRQPNRRSAYLAGADDYMTKPFAPDALITRLRACMDAAGRTQAAASCLSLTIEPDGSLEDLGALNVLATSLYCRSDLAPEIVEAVRQQLSSVAEAAGQWAADHGGKPPLRLTMTLDGERLRLRFEPTSADAEPFLAKRLAPGGAVPSMLIDAGAIDQADRDGESIVFEKALPRE